VFTGFPPHLLTKEENNNVLKLDPSWTKNRKPTLQPLPKRLVMQLESFCGSRIVQSLYQRFCRNFTCPKDALLYVPNHPARELDKDLKAAGIPKHTDDGKVAFHAMRTCFVTLAYEAGANHKEAQQLARHSTPGLTANTYGRNNNLQQIRGNGGGGIRTPVPRCFKTSFYMLSRLNFFSPY